MDDVRIEHGFPLFPLGLVALPHELVPLHIFEERYRKMIAACLEDEREFGIVWSGPDDVQRIGCAVEITEVLERMDDGRLNILTRGTRPFLIQAHSDVLEYPSGTVEWVEDVPEPGEAEAEQEARSAYHDLVLEVTDRDLAGPELGAMGAYAMAATVELPNDAKQHLLDLRSENARLELVAHLFADARERLDAVSRAAACARSNGRVRF